MKFFRLLAITCALATGSCIPRDSGRSGGGNMCTKGCPCGASCISCSYTCHKEDEEVITPDGEVVPIEEATLEDSDGGLE